MSKGKWIVLVVLVWAVLAVVANAQTVKPKYIYKLFRLNPSELGIVCQNGADPTGTKVGDMVIISCGK
jgi:hypothetical protein